MLIKTFTLIKKVNKIITKLGSENLINCSGMIEENISLLPNAIDKSKGIIRPIPTRSNRAEMDDMNIRTNSLFFPFEEIN